MSATTSLPASVERLLRDPVAMAAIERLRGLGYSADQVRLTMAALEDGLVGLTPRPPAEALVLAMEAAPE